MRRLAAAALLLLGAAACGTARFQEPLRPPVVLNDPEEQRGQVVFMRNCNPCHPQGEGGLGPALNNKRVPGAAIKYQVRHGLGDMPSFSDKTLSDDQLDDLVDYMMAVRGNSRRSY